MPGGRVGVHGIRASASRRPRRRRRHGVLGHRLLRRRGPRRRRSTASPRAACGSRSSTTPRAAARRARRCSPGLHPHQTGIGILTNDDRPQRLPRHAQRALRHARRGAAAGRVRDVPQPASGTSPPRCGHPTDAWPTRRGFDRFFGTLTGCGSFFSPARSRAARTTSRTRRSAPGFFYTDAITDEAEAFVREQRQPRARASVLPVRRVHRAALAAARA